MKTQEALTNEEVRKRFEEACGKVWRWFKLDEKDDFFPIDDPQKELDELKKEYNTPEKIAAFNERSEGITTFENEVQELEDLVFYNMVVDQIDIIYAEILMYAKTMAFHPETFGWDADKFWTEVLNMGTFKSDIDDEKAFNEDFAEEKIYPDIPKADPITDKDELKKFLLG